MLRKTAVKHDLEYIVPLRRSNQVIVCRLRDWIPWNIFIHGCYITESGYESFMLEKASGSEVIMDVGANIGYYSVRFSALTDGNVYSFEPMSYQYSVLKRNLELNRIDNVIPVKRIASNTGGEKRIYYSGSDNTGASSMVKESGEYEDIQAITIDGFCDEQKITRIDLMKIDVEGHEMDVLRGMSGCLRRQSVRHLFVEISGENLKKSGSSVQELCTFLKASGYHPHSIKTGKIGEYRIGDDESLVYFTVPAAGR
ncbi:FkbM family methyltransferase [Balneolales bacterium ANBcel1]|nr:FkbM family methyltransferase [Balneolales bacterium ANBcel1]